MKTTGKDMAVILNDRGYLLVTAMMIMLLLVGLGFIAMNTTSFELLISGNDKRIKQNFFYTEGAGVEVSGDINLLGSMSELDCNATSRTSCLNAYAVTDLNEQRFLTTINGASTPVDQPKINNITDASWPTNYQAMHYGAPGGFQSREYAYRVYYWGMGPVPKGYGTNYGSFIFDVTARKQNTDTTGSLTQRGAILNQGFIKIGPVPGV